MSIALNRLARGSSRFIRSSQLLKCVQHSSTLTSPIRVPMPYFDADRFIAGLGKEGFSAQQAQAVIDALEDVVTESTINVTGSLVSRAEQEDAREFAKLKSEIQITEKRDVEEAKLANERLKSELDKLRKSLQEDIVRSQAGVRLDLNLEKGRIRDELVGHHEKLSATDEKIEGEVLELRRHMKEIKLQILQYMIGTITGAGTLILGYVHFLH
ncbi:hypothetical protein PHYBLDRAFT_152606 [Phycomyces blakesleeanus NRRL 1555(-)]|uniref:DUF1640 domain-containing protein n=1 Tax=Phycomyces blakesleeanus (strain ATCC 8743b / DSM 1359 / FGSC 10004 / NBRC 33097 / NRRL 1555) TaxID=763407 RepID=A0A167JM22_PHYB8|nr:hypothetical protein PHYBLDRAFT_152606 [Phycomyces blakesleeanus NRRL 1555(-)]OAD66279.1 hypothetical protein PHYBLDRAFT_152606 [Phycomyces blakesleeanus NRRL 1555(-)]|eukprot:XP_018284319.1 hypothetical protein PHYBLDRAFT_152606 [Phycomyces blakesleeanus NRRL 1555(-)]